MIKLSRFAEIQQCSHGFDGLAVRNLKTFLHILLMLDWRGRVSKTYKWYPSVAKAAQVALCGNIQFGFGGLFNWTTL